MLKNDWGPQGDFVYVGFILVDNVLECKRGI